MMGAPHLYKFIVAHRQHRKFEMNMRRFFQITFRTMLFILLIATIAGIWNRDKIRRLVRVNSLFSEELIVSNFSNMESMFFHKELSVAGDTVSPLPSAPQPLPE